MTKDLEQPGAAHTVISSALRNRSGHLQPCPSETFLASPVPLPDACCRISPCYASPHASYSVARVFSAHKDRNVEVQHRRRARLTNHSNLRCPAFVHPESRTRDPEKWRVRACRGGRSRKMETPTWCRRGSAVFEFLPRRRTMKEDPWRMPR